MLSARRAPLSPSTSRRPRYRKNGCRWYHGETGAVGGVATGRPLKKPALDAESGRTGPRSASASRRAGMAARTAEAASGALRASGKPDGRDETRAAASWPRRRPVPCVPGRRRAGPCPLRWVRWTWGRRLLVYVPSTVRRHGSQCASAGVMDTSALPRSWVAAGSRRRLAHEVAR